MGFYVRRELNIKLRLIGTTSPVNSVRTSWKQLKGGNQAMRSVSVIYIKGPAHGERLVISLSF